MKTVTMVEVYNLLKEISLAGMTFKGQRAVLKNLRSMKPVAENYISSIEEAQTKLKPEGFEEMEQKANLHNEAIKNGTEEGRLYGEELQEIAFRYNEYNSAITAYITDLNEEENNFIPETISEEDFEKLVTANEKMEAGKLALLDETLCA